jgi:uncharacterized membrane protein
LAGRRFISEAGIADAEGMTEAERERAIRGVRENYARGGLTNDELDEQLDVLFAARTGDELSELVPEINATGSDLDAVERHLSSGERIEWVGRPDPTKHFTSGDVFLIPFSLMWGGFSIFWEAGAIAGGAGVFFALWGIPFVAIGLYFIFGRFIYKAYRKRRTIYAITNRRVLAIVRRRNDEAVEATYLSSIPNISTHAVSNGRGSVEFGLSSPMAGRYGNSGMELLARGQMATGISFYDIEDPRGVADLVERLRDQDRAR